MAKDADPSTCIHVRIIPSKIHFFTKIMEAYGHLVFLSPVKPGAGVVALYATPDNMPQVLEIVRNFPHPVEILQLTIDN